MCGIAGWIADQEPEAPEVIDAQLRLLDHRGPDARGIYARKRGAIGQNRLSIIDLKTGDPPITNEDGSIGVSLNGEIYNFRALRAKLSEQGHTFHSEGDTEALAHLAEDLEPADIARAVDGMFAFAIWDAGAERLILGRDRMGKKPLYYWTDGRSLAFGSEIKAVLAHPAVPRELEERAIPAYLTFGYVPTPLTFFRGVRSVPPGHVLVMEPGAEPRLESYWAPPRPADRPNNPISFADAAHETRRLFTAAVERRLISDVPLGAFLSGGIDSSAVVAVMSELSDQPVQTFTIGFEDAEGFDERPFATAVAERFKTDHTEFVVRPEAVDLIERLVWHHDQPFGDSSAVPTYMLCEQTRTGVTVALSGDGGDELYAGYERFAAAQLLRHHARLPSPVQRGLRSAVERVPPDAARGRAGSVQRFLRDADTGLPDAYLQWLSFVPEEWRQRLITAPDGWGSADFQRIWSESSGAHDLDRLLDVNLRTYLVDDLLVKADRMSMAHGLEVRSPFLDAELVQHAASLPPKYKLRGLSLKRVLKHSFSDVLPREILRRRKRGFGVPLDRWFASDLRTYLESMLGSPDSHVRSHVAPDAVDAMLAEQRAGRRSHSHALWTLLTLEVFLRREGW